jgi:hypothetical protein
MGYKVRQRAQPLRDREMWSLAGIIFFWGVAAVAIAGGIAYAIFLWPRIGLSILGGFLALLGISLGIALMITRRGNRPGS